MDETNNFFFNAEFPIYTFTCTSVTSQSILHGSEVQYTEEDEDYNQQALFTRLSIHYIIKHRFR